MELYVILGYLAGGKTTLVANIVKMFAHRKIALIINDFGDNNTDETLLNYKNVLKASVSGGSIFCSCKSYEFFDKLVWAANSAPDVIIVETSGLANPIGLEKVIDLTKIKGTDINFKGIIAVADCSKFSKIAASVHMVKAQIAYADLILLNKCDLCPPEKIRDVANLLRGMNSRAEIRRTVYSDIDTNDITALSHSRQPDIINIMDINIQKAEITFLKNISREDLSRLCGRIEKFCDRIKGVTKFEGVCRTFEYVDGGLRVHSEAGDKSFMTVLSVTGNLQKRLKEAIEGFEEVVKLND